MTTREDKQRRFREWADAVGPAPCSVLAMSEPTSRRSLLTLTQRRCLKQYRRAYRRHGRLTIFSTCRRGNHQARLVVEFTLFRWSRACDMSGAFDVLSGSND